MIKYSGFEVEERVRERFEEFYFGLQGHLRNIHDVHSGEIFNSGYVGLIFYVGDVKCVIIEQPGAVGMEDQSPGYIELKIGRENQRIVTHKERGFGDVKLAQWEIDQGYNKMANIILDRFL